MYQQWQVFLPLRNFPLQGGLLVQRWWVEERESVDSRVTGDGRGIPRSRRISSILQKPTLTPLYESRRQGSPYYRIRIFFSLSDWNPRSRTLLPKPAWPFPRYGVIVEVWVSACGPGICTGPLCPAKDTTTTSMAISRDSGLTNNVRSCMAFLYLLRHGPSHRQKSDWLEAGSPWMRRVHPTGGTERPPQM